MLTVLTGRSRRLWPHVTHEIGWAWSEGAERLLLITPDQYTLQAELELVKSLDLPGLLTIEVLSPSRLLTRVFSVAGSPNRVRIDALGKAMVLSDLLRSSRKELAVYRDAFDRNGLVERLSACIGDLKRAGLRPEDVMALADRFGQRDLLHGKLSDIALLYHQYEQRLSGAFLDGEDVQEALLLKLPESGLLKNAHIWIYGFDLISPQFLRQIAVMARHAHSVRLALTFDDNSARDGAVFQPARDTLFRLGRFFDRERMLWKMERVGDALKAPPEIIHLERELFAIPIKEYNPASIPRPAADIHTFSGHKAPRKAPANMPQPSADIRTILEHKVSWKTIPIVKNSDENNAVELWTASTPYDEAARAAAAILRLARTGTRFDQIAVIVGDISAYVGPIEAAFSRAEIPFHLSKKRRALSHPLIYGFLAALRCATRGFRLDDAILWLKSCFSGLSAEEAQRLENYAIEFGLYGNKWRRTIENGPVETLRQRFMEPLETLFTGLRKAKNITELLTAAYRLLEDVFAYDTLLVLQRDLTERGLLVEVSECAQAWKALLQTFDQLHTLIPINKPALSSFPTVLEAGLMTVDLGAVPSWPGLLQVGELGHMKLGGTYRAVLLLGMQDGVMQTTQEGLLSDAEIMKALEHTDADAAFGLTNDSLARLKQVNLLDIIAAPTEKLIVSHALTGASGEALRPAVVLKLLEKAIPKVAKKSGAEMDRWFSRGAALHELGPAIQDAAKRERELSQKAMEAAAWLMFRGETRGDAENILRLLETPPFREKLSEHLAHRLYAKSRTSASRLETFALCPFAHFVQYGLQPAVRREFTVAADETGIFYHAAMEAYTSSALRHLTWPDVTREESDALMDAVLSPLKAEWERKPLSDNAMLRAKGEMYSRIARRAAWNYANQMRQGKFRTGQTEIRFGHGETRPPIVLPMSYGHDVFLEGRIDRVDFYEENGDKWLRVVDYKSGRMGLDPAMIYGGVQLQLLIYLMAALSAFPGAQAAGAFYSHFSDPLVELDRRDELAIEKKITEELELSGIQLADARVVRALENASRYLNKDGTMRKTARTATTDQLDALTRYAHSQAMWIAEHIGIGEIAPMPAAKDQWSACEWCGYQSVCRFDGAVGANRVRRLEKMGFGELLERVEIFYASF